MPSTTRSRSTSQAASTARSQVLKQLKDDHGRVKKAYREFEKFDPVEGAEYCEAIVQQVLRELTVHAALEEELLYPAARGAIANEAIEQQRNMEPKDDKCGARFTVLCEYGLHHVKEEEGEIFPQLERTRLGRALGERAARPSVCGRPECLVRAWEQAYERLCHWKSFAATAVRKP
jgi:hemerythrin superfamily protein